MNVGGDSYQVHIRNQEGQTLANHVMIDNNDGTYQVQYTPTKATNHIIQVTLDSKPVSIQDTYLVPVTISPTISGAHSKSHGPGVEPWGLFTNMPTEFTIVGVDNEGNRMTSGDATADFVINLLDGKNDELVLDHDS
ncbi:hypothetical protein AKO1_003625, partial [Acrasis kona]